MLKLQHEILAPQGCAETINGPISSPESTLPLSFPQDKGNVGSEDEIVDGACAHPRFQERT